MTIVQSLQVSSGACLSAGFTGLLLLFCVFVRVVGMGRLDRVILSEQPDKAAVGCGDRRALQIVVQHEMRHLANGNMRPECAGPWPHDALRRFVRVPLQLGFAEQTENDPLVVHHHARFPAGGPDPLPDQPDLLAGSAGRDVPPSYVAGSGLRGIVALGWKAGGQPVNLPVDVVVNVGKPETFEPPRGPCTEVSGGVPAVDQDRPCGIQPALCLSVDLPKRQVDRSRKVVFLELLSTQNLDHLNAPVHQRLDFASLVNVARHGCSPLRSWVAPMTYFYPSG